MINFPDAPTVGQAFTNASLEWRWDGAKWTVPPGSASSAGGGGDITAVTAGAGLSGGGSSGDVIVSLTTPVAVSNGGTGATTAPGALIALGAAPLAAPVFTGDARLAISPATADNDTSIATTAFVKAQGYIAGNQLITLSGDVAGSGSTSIAATLATVNANVGTFQGLTVDAKGRVTAAVNMGYTVGGGGPFVPITGNSNITGNINISGAFGVNSDTSNFYSATLLTTVASARQITIGENSNNAGFRLALGYALIGGGTWTGVVQATAGGAGGPLAINANGGNVGIGTPAPGFLLDVNGETRIRHGVDHNLRIRGSYTLADGTSLLSMNDAFSGWQSLEVVATNIFLNPVGTGVGIGVSPPTAKLDVAGDVNVSGAILNVRAKYSPWADVKAWGAVGNGVTNDSAAFQAAIDWVAGNGGGVVNIPNGQYALYNTINVGPFVKLVGESWFNTILHTYHHDVVAVHITGIAGELRNLHVIGYGMTQMAQGGSVDIDGYPTVIDGYPSPNTHALVIDLNGSKIIDCVIHGGIYAVLVKSQDTVFERSWISLSLGPGWMKLENDGHVWCRRVSFDKNFPTADPSYLPSSPLSGGVANWTAGQPVICGEIRNIGGLWYQMIGTLASHANPPSQPHAAYNRVGGTMSGSPPPYKPYDIATTNGTDGLYWMLLCHSQSTCVVVNVAGTSASENYFEACDFSCYSLAAFNITSIPNYGVCSVRDSVAAGGAIGVMYAYTGDKIDFMGCELAGGWLTDAPTIYLTTSFVGALTMVGNQLFGGGHHCISSDATTSSSMVIANNNLRGAITGDFVRASIGYNIVVSGNVNKSSIGGYGVNLGGGCDYFRVDGNIFHGAAINAPLPNTSTHSVGTNH